MKTLTVQIDESGVVRVPPEARLGGLSRFRLILAEPNEEQFSAETMEQVAQDGGAFDFLASEPDLYTDADIEPGHENPEFRGHAKGQ